jgi:hypothetical protein
MERYHREEWAFANTGRTDSNLGLAAGDALSEAREAGRRIAAQAVLEQFKRYLAYSCHRALGSSTSVRNIITHIMLLLRQLDRDMAQVMHSSYPAPIFSHEPPVPDPVEALERLRVQLTDILTP